jgi:hypothetical protein
MEEKHSKHFSGSNPGREGIAYGVAGNANGKQFHE